jgi:CRP-like cAMP-binding protein
LNAPSSGGAIATGKKRAFRRQPVATSFDSGTFLAKEGNGKTVLKYHKGQIVFSQGDAANALFYIQKGKIKLTVVSERGKEAIVGILGPEHFFGEACLHDRSPRATTATVINDCLVTRIEKASMISAMHDEPKLSEVFTADLLNRNGRIEGDLIDQLFNSSEKRLARVLLLLANFSKKSGPQPIIGTFSQETLAEMVGTTRSRVSFFMNKFRKLGYVEYRRRKLQIHDSLLNVVLRDKP